MKLRFFHSAIITATAGILVFSACSSGDQPAQTSEVKAITVKTALPSQGNKEGVTASGQLQSSRSADISTRVMGYITAIHVKAGDRVTKGQLLVSISNEDILAKKAQTEAAIAEASAAYQNAAKDFQRYNALYKEQSASAKELDNISLQYASAGARLKAAKQMKNEAQAMLAYTNLRAPFSGVVTRKLADAGNMASPGLPLLTIEQQGEFEVTAAIPETEITKLKTGQQAKMSIKSGGKTFTGVIREINQSSASTGGQYLIKITVPANEKKGLYSGMYVNVFIPIARETGSVTNEGSILVPLKSIVMRDQMTGIYTVSNSSQAVLRWVRLGKQYNGEAEVLSGLGKDEKFILEAQGRLYNGVPVKESNQ
ncbi:RND family efflux transporter MFP subunit [Arcticibacter tournemirensis]|uniref:Efflux RND transporter periplasmic adaptor subunit n=1 Tax=Arcticibacter tournemirensis TaxID=699437 RepID=A0A5M9GST3_9SPHI|nr:efflux RND transporter periplasmic adaptor subunit [Arcticibacter tournemirensis]KAA8476785.1 efflux RND transporter periplasmic adaptor subunit [Arcticibacter tournemirensis]TQM50805.1 RND family efflux transporter MFP subunit [Arcticibacter tournemirensis]